MKFALQEAARYNQRMFVRLVMSSVLFASVAACAPKARSTRARTGLDTYLGALRDSDPQAMYSMLSEATRAGTDYQQWSQQWLGSAAERELQATQIEEQLSANVPISEHARLRFADGRGMTLTRTRDGWRLNEALTGRTEADSPLDALAIFSTALRERNFNNLLRILSSSKSTSIANQYQEFHTSLEVQLAAPESNFYVVGRNQAELAWNHKGLRYRVKLTREEETWKIEDVHIGPDPTLEAEQKESQTPRETQLELLRRRR